MAAQKCVAAPRLRPRVEKRSVAQTSRAAAEMRDREDPFIRDEQGNPLMVKGTEAPEEAATESGE